MFILNLLQQLCEIGSQEVMASSQQGTQKQQR